ncbi:MAG: SOS response-associated peptidase [Planctomycetaceae bacterium]|nr:SOS response-associated peptidase [Planctomycetaceae bacterium]
MCGRFTLRASASVLAEQFAAIADITLVPRFNVAPSQPIAVVRERAGSLPPQRELAMVRWGLIPSWAKDPAIGSRMINARSETVGDKPAFRAAFRRRRCLVPADGFFEWQRRGKSKQPYFIQMAGEQPFAMAGLWESWTGPDGSEVESCAILTTVPNELMEAIHDRMPVILPSEAYGEWLDPEQADPEPLKRLLAPFDAGQMKVHAVSSYVNRPSNEGPECIAPVAALF